MFDLVIRNGTVFDGTGAPRRVADVAVQDGRIAAVGPELGKGRREIDAAGLMVTPGFVDIHTHYDGQATWDPFVTPSSWHGVTTTVFGNCGVGFAPVRPGKSPYLINLMEGVEDIPGTVLNEGVKFDWESFPDYLDTLAVMGRAVDVAAQLPHGALRFYVMGDRGADHAESPRGRETLDQIHGVRKAGRLANAQVGSRPIGVIMGLETTAHPFAAHPAWLEMRKLSPAERCARLAADADLRRRLVEEPTDSRAFMAGSFHKMFPVGDRPDYEPDANNSIAAIAQRGGRTPQAVALDELMSRDGKGLLMLPFENYAHGSLDVVHEMITDSATVLGVADGGAHVGVICDASSPTSLLTLWGRDRTRGPKLPLEFLVAKQTRGTAEAYGLCDRGLLA